MIDKTINHDIVYPSDCCALVLAAGLSSRMGKENKLTLMVHDKPLLQHVVNAITGAGINRVVIVLGHEQESVESSIAFEPATGSDQTATQMSIVVNADYAQGQAGSVTCGLQALQDHKGPTIICLGDQPLIKSEHILTLIDTFNQRENKQVVIPRVNDQRGNPIMISRLVRQRVLAEKDNPSCRQYIDNHSEELLWLDSQDKAFITDLDTPDDVKNFLKSSKSEKGLGDGYQ